LYSENILAMHGHKNVKLKAWILAEVQMCLNARRVVIGWLEPIPCFVQWKSLVPTLRQVILNEILCATTHMLRRYLKLGQYLLLAYPLQLIIRCTVWATDSVIKWIINDFRDSLLHTRRLIGWLMTEDNFMKLPEEIYGSQHQNRFVINFTESNETACRR